LQIHEAKDKKEKPYYQTDISFGKFYTDHMLSIDWDASTGWDKP
jgi:hypothetical protein